jgi:hypothetical protein
VLERQPTDQRVNHCVCAILDAIETMLGSEYFEALVLAQIRHRFGVLLTRSRYPVAASTGVFAGFIEKVGPEVLPRLLGLRVDKVHRVALIRIIHTAHIAVFREFLVVHASISGMVISCTEACYSPGHSLPHPPDKKERVRFAQRLGRDVDQLVPVLEGPVGPDFELGGDRG